MAKGKPPKDIRARRAEGKKPPRKNEPPQSIVRRVWSLVVGVSVVLGVVGGYFYLKPTIEIETPSSNPSDAYQLFSRPFVIKNNSPFFSVSDVHARCGIVRVLYDPTGSDVHGLATELEPPISEFGAGEEHSFLCSNPMKSPKPIRSAEVILALDYVRPWLYLGHTVTNQSYRALIGSDGRAYWTPYVTGIKPPTPPSE
jgi:hypothetical protein